MKPEHHHYHRLHQHLESGAASHTSIQQSGASSGLDHATGSATTDNPQDGSPRSNHWLDTATSSHFRSRGVKNIFPRRRKNGESWSAERSRVKIFGYQIRGKANVAFVTFPIWARSVVVSVPCSLCSCSALLCPSCLAAQRRSAERRNGAKRARRGGATEREARSLFSSAPFTCTVSLLRSHRCHHGDFNACRWRQLEGKCQQNSHC